MLMNTTSPDVKARPTHKGVYRSVLSRITRWAWLQVLVLSALAAAPASVSAQHFPNNVKPRTPAQVETPTVYRSNQIDWGLVYRVHDLICKARIREPKIVMAQAVLETGWFRSTTLMSLNNLFGFRHVRYLSFDRLEDSIEYYKSWQDANMQDSDSNYFLFLERIRYGAPGYSRHVKKIDWNEECPLR